MLVPRKSKTKLRKNRKIYCFLLTGKTNKDLINKFKVLFRTEIKNKLLSSRQIRIFVHVPNKPQE